MTIIHLQSKKIKAQGRANCQYQQYSMCNLLCVIMSLVYGLFVVLKDYCVWRLLASMASNVGQHSQAVGTHWEVFRSLTPLLVERTGVILRGPTLVPKRKALGKSKSGPSPVSELLSHTAISLNFTDSMILAQNFPNRSKRPFLIRLLTQLLLCSSET